MIWDGFLPISFIALTSWIISSLYAIRHESHKSMVFSLIGLFVYFAFIVVLWVDLSRPPMKTVGETRMLYAGFMPLVGLLSYKHHRYQWILPFTTVMAAVFILINVLKPEIHSRVLMPALQSPWFVPHVVVYMISYAFLTCSFIVAIAAFFNTKKDFFPLIDDFVSAGTGLFVIATFIGAIWAKQAWGSFWTWDPKETWALITLLVYLLYFSLRKSVNLNRNVLLLCLFVAFLFLQMCWWGINYLPSASESVHLYQN